MKIARVVMRTAMVASMIAVAGCSASAPSAGPTTATNTVATTKPRVASPVGTCRISPDTEPTPTAEQFRPVPEVGRVSVALSGVTSRVMKPGDPPTEVDLTVCNDSAVSYRDVGFVLLLGHCTCALVGGHGPAVAQGTVARFDPATDVWIPSKVPAEGTGADALSTFTNVQDLPKGKSVRLRYRVALDASMTDGDGSVLADVVTPDSLALVGKANLPFMVSTAAPPAVAPTPTPRQSILPFTGFDDASDLAVDAAGDVYVVDSGNDQVLRVAAGADGQTVLPFTGLKDPSNLAVNAAGDVYLSDHDHHVVKLAAGSDTQSVLPFMPPKFMNGLAVDADGNVYVTTDTQVLKYAAGDYTQTALPMTEIQPRNLAVDADHNVYVSDYEEDGSRVVRLAAGSNAQTVLPFTGLDYPSRAAVDGVGNVYVANGRQVVKLAPGSTAQALLPFTGLNDALQVAVDKTGNVYVLDDSGFGRVVKLAAG